jgi:hypothetical protein
MVDATTQAALQAPVVHWRVLLYADFVGDVFRGTSGLYDKVISGAADSELNGTYESYDHNLIQVSPVQHNEAGSDTVSVTMSGLIINASFLNLIGDKTRWQGRIARLWFYCVDENENQVGSVIPYYTGYMNEVGVSGSPESQTLTLTVENYLVSLTGAQNKTYLMQNIFDSGDLSGEAAISAANGIQGGGLLDASVGWRGGAYGAMGDNFMQDSK